MSLNAARRTYARRRAMGKVGAAWNAAGLRGHYNYFGVSGNFRSLLRFAEAVRRLWLQWLLRRSQRHRLNWERYDALLTTRWALPKPRIAVKIWGASP